MLLKSKAFFLFLLCFLITSLNLFAQLKTIKGRIKDASTGEAMPFVNVSFRGTTIGTVTDFDGYYNLQTINIHDSLTASYIGYKSFSKSTIKNLPIQNIDFQLESSETKLGEVKIVFIEDPAYPIMREVIKNKPNNSSKSLSAYECEVYTKTEFDVDNFSSQIKKQKLYKKIIEVVDSIQHMEGENGKTIVPIFISESISQYYYLNKPEKRKENILKSKVAGLAVTDGSTVSQLIGSTFQQYDFYKNWLSILNKDFVSPLADSWKGYYKYYLIDSLFINNYWCYKIDIEPKRVQDLAFSGTIWIDSKSFALVQINVSIGKSANINFIEQLKIQQELIQTEAGPWLPSKSRVLINVAELTKGSPGILAKFYTSNKNVLVNKPKPLKFFDEVINLDENATKFEKNYWDIHRHDTLSGTERNVYKIIDSVKNIPIVKTYIEIANIISYGYKRIGMFDYGPYSLLFAYNNIEGARFRVGFKSNASFSRKLILNGYLAYGTKDQQFKYDAQVHYLINRKPWTIIGIKYKHDLEQVGRMTDDLIDNNLFVVSTRYGTMRRPFLRNDYQLYFTTDIKKGLRQSLRFRYFDFNPVGDFSFAYYENSFNDNLSNIKYKYETSEISGETRISKDETFIYSENERISIGTKKLPVLTFSYTFGLKGVFNSNFDYIKLGFNAYQNLKMGTLGNSSYIINVGYVPSQVPYPLLYVHRGNQSFFYNAQTFNLMNFFEFVSDAYGSIKYEHHFEGIFFNRLPLVRKLKWRFVAGGNVLWGSVRSENRLIIPDKVNGKMIDGFNSLSNVPYTEVSYGIENIFKFVRLDFVHRLTYRDSPGVSTFGVKISTQFKF